MLPSAARSLCSAVFSAFIFLPTLASAASELVPGQVRVMIGEFHGGSHPVKSLPLVPDPQKARKIPLRLPPIPEARMVADPVTQSSSGALVSTSDINNFLGIGAGFSGPSGAYTVNAAPPDTIGAVGKDHYIQWVNTSFAIFDKATQAVIAGPLPGNATWTGIDHACARTNDGDPVVLYDRAADRWILTQLSYSEGTYYQCVSVSKTGDPTGEYWLYAWDWGLYLNDYPKMGVWGDAYYLSTNDFLLGVIFSGPSLCAIRRDTILNGQPTLMVCYAESGSYSGLLPANLTGPTAPPANSPGLFLGLGSNSLYLWRMAPDWATPDNSVITRTQIPVAAFNRACTQNCIPQPDTAQTLDVLGDRLMQPLVYRNFGTHSALVANHSVLTGSTTGIRWYEIRDPFGTPAVFQQGTFTPDTHHRWMGSIGMDKVGNIAVGYSVGGSDLYPSIRYTGREATDTPGVLQSESTIVDGTGSQLTSLNRWGDYSGMSIDPVDDCTFWYTTEYLQNSGTFNWSTRVALFKFPSCDGSGGTNSPPIANFTFSCAYLNCAFTNTSTDDTGIASYVWNFGDATSSTAANPSHTYASASTYSVTLTVTDLNNQSDSVSKAVQVTAPPTINLTATARIVRKQRFADLVWSGAITSTVDVYRNGAKVKTTANDGTYTDSVKRTGTYTYKVCNLGTTTCSNNASVTF
jgi:PKD repeat protein